MKRNLFALQINFQCCKINVFSIFQIYLFFSYLLHLVASSTLANSQENTLDIFYNTSFEANLSTEFINDKNTTNSQFKIVSYFFAFLIFIPIIICTIVGNMLVVLAVVIVRKLHTQDNANNFLIVSLAISDFLVGVMVMPFHVYLELSTENKWYLGAIFCDLWTMFDVLLCTASILNLCAISVDRYFIILHSMQYTQRRNFKLMLLMIIIVWLLAGLISIPPLFGWGKPSARLQREYVCSVSDDLKYQIYATLLAFYLPLIVMIIIYLNIFRAARKIKKREMETAGRLKYTPSLSVSPDYQIEPLIKMDKQTNGNIKSSCNRSKTNGIFCCRKFRDNKENNLKEESKSNETLPSVRNTKKENSNMKLNASYGNIDSRRSSNVKKLSNFIYFHISGKRNSGQLSSGKNQKATKTLGVIMGCFTLCWLPFFILAVFKPIPLGNGFYVANYIPKWLDSLLLWLGYFNSALNPMIYARFNREFRRPFIEILCFRCKGINDKLRDEERKKMYAAEINYSHNPSQLISMNYSSNNLKALSVNNKENFSADAEEKNFTEKIENKGTNENLTVLVDFGELNSNTNKSDILNKTEIETIDIDAEAIKKLLKQQKNQFFFGTSDSPNNSISRFNTTLFNLQMKHDTSKDNSDKNDYNNNFNQTEYWNSRPLKQFIEKESNQLFEKSYMSETFNSNGIFNNKIYFSSSTTNESLNFPTKFSSQENEDDVVLNQNFTNNESYTDNKNHENFSNLSVVRSPVDNSSFNSNIHLGDQDQCKNLFNSVSLFEDVNNVNTQNESENYNILASNNNGCTNEFSTKSKFKECLKNKNKSPKSERSRQRKLTHSSSDNLKPKPTSNKPQIQLAYCTRNKNFNGCRSPIRVTSNTKCSNSNNYEIKIKEENAKCSDTNIIRIPSLSTVISESDQKSFVENIKSTSNSCSLNETSPVLSNRALLFAFNSSRNLKNNSSSIFPGISTDV